MPYWRRSGGTSSAQARLRASIETISGLDSSKLSGLATLPAFPPPTWFRLRACHDLLGTKCRLTSAVTKQGSTSMVDHSAAVFCPLLHTTRSHEPDYQISWEVNGWLLQPALPPVWLHAPRHNSTPSYDHACLEAARLMAAVSSPHVERTGHMPKLSPAHTPLICLWCRPPLRSNNRQTRLGLGHRDLVVVVRIKETLAYAAEEENLDCGKEA
ncbi:uncharacterized protein LY79DRAFT_187788 [Colletotrichum navitas]|uniref:Uncharacterized protein n=1 Tax=Colletotrichum navitas TaxID=681940 RepID=A0AAD8Q0A1_9PEZI|nr:uncharacterized protein LY79DRAFT_187788 [Colletotrichum navitas]KAK1593109.1 hypothetical protein LY79DRAFT_187788 [Colletotrichum navitas]